MTRYARAAAEYLERLRVRGYSVLTIRLQVRRLRTFERFLAAAGVRNLDAIDGETIRRYIRHLQETPIRHGPGAREKRRRHADYIRVELVKLAAFFRSLAAQKKIPADPFAGVELPPPALRVPRNALTEAEAVRLLAAPATEQPQGVRDRALLELAYGAGLRPQELVGLDVGDADLAGRQVTIRAGVARAVPLGAMAAAWLGRYLTEARPVQVRDSRERALFLNYSGGRLELCGLTEALRRSGRQAGIGRRLGWHTLRQGCAARLLREGAAEAAVRELLDRTPTTPPQYRRPSAQAAQRPRSGRRH